jgi:hypothetical protein
MTFCATKPGKRVDGKLPGQIYLGGDDKQKSYLAGSFEAVLKDDEKGNWSGHAATRVPVGWTRTTSWPPSRL